MVVAAGTNCLDDWWALLRADHARVDEILVAC
jgi:hypothetical protein